MSLNVANDTTIKDKFNDYQGIFSLWGLIFSNIFTFIFISLCFVKLFAWASLPFYYLIFHGILIALFQSIVWNSIHPSLHFVGKELTIIEGPDFINRNWFQTTKLHELLWTNHVIHHLVPEKKQGNFNGSLIGEDYLFGTYRTRSDCPEFIIDSKKLTIQKRVKILENSHNIK